MRALLLSCMLLASCASQPWTVRVENSRAVEVPRVACAIQVGTEGGGGSGPVRAGGAIEFTTPSRGDAGDIELSVTWKDGASPVPYTFHDLPATSKRVVLRLTEDERVEIVPPH